MRNTTFLPAVRAVWASSMHEVEDGTLTWANSTQWAINRLSTSQITLALRQTSGMNSNSKRPCKYYNDTSCSYEGHHGSYAHICAYCYKQGKQFTHPEFKCTAKQRQANRTQQTNSYGPLRPLEPRLEENSQGHNSNLNAFKKLVLSRKYVNSSSDNLVASDCSNVYVCNVPTVDNNQFDGELYDEYNIEFDFVNNCEVTHELHDSYGEADISVHSGSYTVSLSTVDILNSCFHDTLDNSIKCLVFIHNNSQNVFRGFCF